MKILEPVVSVVAWIFSVIVQVVTNYLYSSKVVFNTVWEDPRVDLQALELTPKDRMLIITSAGCNALEHCLQGIEHVYCIDKNPCQNALMELKIAGIKELDYDTFWKLFGIGRLENFTKQYYPRLRGYLTPEAQKFWDKNSHYFDGGWFRSTFYWRSCAGTLAWIMSLYFHMIPGLHKAVHEVFDAYTIEDQKRLYFQKVERKLFNPISKKLMESQATLSWTGIPVAQQELLKGADNIGMFIKKSLEYVICEMPLRDNHFWTVFLKGSYTKDNCPGYLKEENFKKLKGGLVNNVSVHTATITEFLKEHQKKDISRFLLLDHMDWMAQAPEILSEEWQEILDHSTPNAKYLWRSAAPDTKFVRDAKVVYQGKQSTVGEVLSFNDKLAAKLHLQDRVHTYTSFTIADLKQQEAN